MTIIGFEWNQTNDKVTHLNMINIKTLILHDGEYKKYTTSGFITISSSLPTYQQFLSDGMDSLSPLLDRKVTTLEPQPMTDESEILQGEEGKVFSKTLDLKKYIDIRSVKIKN